MGSRGASLRQVLHTAICVERVGQGGPWPTWILKLLAKKVVFSNSRGKIQFRGVLLKTT